MNYEFFN